MVRPIKQESLHLYNNDKQKIFIPIPEKAAETGRAMVTDPLQERELSDRFNPVLVKELRRGVRSNVYVVWFLASQTAMVAVSLSPLAFGDSGNIETGRNEDAIFATTFWVIVTLALMFTPMRALFSLGRERKQNMLETILMTKAGCSRVAFGTWYSFMAQNALFCTSVLPYLLARYLMGGEEIVSEVLNLLSILVISGSLTATAIAFSAAPSLERKIIVLFLLGGLNLGMWLPSMLLSVVFVFLPWSLAFLLYSLATVPLIILTMVSLAQTFVKNFHSR